MELRGKFGIMVVVVVALESLTSLTREAAVSVDFGGTASVLIKLAGREMFRAKMPVHVHGAHTNLEVRNCDGNCICVEKTLVPFRHVGCGLLSGLVDFVHDTSHVG
jgi:hypothetical protein